MIDLSVQNIKKWSQIKKWLYLAILLFGLLLIGYLIYLYNHIQTNKTEDFVVTQERVFAETNIDHIDAIERYHDKQYYHIVYGTDAKEKEYIAFIPQTDEGEIITISKDEMLSESTIKSNWKKSCQTCQFIRLTPAIIDDEILWELTYVTQADQYVFNYYTINDGQLYEQVKLLQMFK